MMTQHDVPEYCILEQLYSGSRTLVYRAIREADQCPVVIKLLRNEHPSFSELVQFRNQYAITKNLDIPGIIQPYSLEAYRNGYALIMEDFDGVSLRAWIKQQSRGISDFFSIALQLADTLHLLHQQRVIHKDIKPSNILIHPDSHQVKLLDFSISTLLPRETQESQNPAMPEGTLAYLSPEQTGRMNRGVDYRSDFYSLGITFYELLAGQLPFQANDPMELVHCHLAQYPPAIHSLNSLVPPILSELIAKLMAKNAEDRYQSALGLKFDLERCLAQYQETGKIEPFALGDRDRSDRFTIPEKLYGREPEVAALLAAFERVAGSGRVGEWESGRVGEWEGGRVEHSPRHPITPPPHHPIPPSHSELMLVAGFSGIGKTAVVNEVHKPIARQRGYFIKGKFDQFQRNIPFSALVQAFRHLMAQLLSESDTQLAQWKAHILAALGENAQIIIEVVPELERILGPQPAIPILTGSAAQNRFNLLFQKFIQVFTTADHPLVVFIDDLQWADSASLHLIKLLMSESETGYLLLLGAYRDNEVFAAHPLMLTLDEITKAGATVNTLTLAPLSADQLNHLVAETLSCTQKLALPLTTLVYQKTQGNPFFTNQFLKMLHEDGLIAFERNLGYWQCDLAQVRSLALTDDVVEFMALQLQKLPVATQTMLKLAACIGAQFDLETLAIVSEQTVAHVAVALWRALQEGLLFPISEVYKFYQPSDVSLQTLDQEAFNCAYRFLHDRVQQAAYSLIADDKKQSTHLQIGRLLQHSTAAPEHNELLFTIVNHFNQGAALIEDAQEQQALVQLNLAAGQKAKSATAYGAALAYFKQGIALLRGDRWQSQYDLALALYEGTAESAYLNGDFEQMQAFMRTILEQARTLLDTVKVYELKIQAALAQNQPLEAVQIALKLLKLLEVTFPEQPTEQDSAQALAATAVLIAGRKPLDLMALPQMHEASKLAAMRILAEVTPCAYISAPALVPLLILEQVKLSIQAGNAPSSAYGYACYSLLLCGILGEIDTGHEFGQLALHLFDQFDVKALKAKTHGQVYGLVWHWKEPVRSTLIPLREAYQSGLDTGDLTWASIAACIYAINAYFGGNALDDLSEELAALNMQLAQIKQEALLSQFSIFQQSVLNLLNQTEHPEQLTGDVFNAAQMLPVLEQSNDRIALCYFYIAKLFLSYLFDDVAAAIAAATANEASIGAATGLFVVPIFYTYDSLAHLAFYAQVAEAEQHKVLERVAANQKKLRTWADHAPMNHLHKFYLVEAEWCRVLGQKVEAIDHYDRAIAAAKANAFLNEEALANELAAKFYLNWGKGRIAQEYMTEAYYSYARWGAKAKIDDLEQRYPQLLASILQQQQQTLTTTDTIFSPTSHSTHASTSSSVTATLDLATVLKVSQTLSGEIELEKLLAALLAVMFENAGAEKCVLMLLAKDGGDRPNSDRLLIKGFMRTGAAPIVLQRLPIEDSPEIPLQLIYRVKHSLQAVVLPHAAADPTLATDPYILQVQPKSVLCSPILHRGKFAGILYLENNLVTGAFTSDRVELLNLLCAQAAISLENAHLYERSQTYAQQLETSLENLQGHKTRFQNLAANIPGMLYQFRLEPDGSHSMPYVSSGCYDLYEIEPAALMVGEHSLHTMQHPDDNIALSMAIGHSAQTLTPLEQEFRIVTRSGQEKWVQAIARPEPQLDKAIVWDGILIDISDRKRSEADRKQAEKALRLTQFAVDHASVPIWWVKPHGNLTYANAAACRELGYTQSEMLQKHVWDFNPDFVSEAWDRHWQELKAKGSLSFETYNINQAGHHYPVDVTVNYLELDGEEYNCAFVRNISDRKQAEIALQEQEQFLRSIYDGVEIGIFVVDVLKDSNLADGSFRYVGWNAASERAAGMSEAAIVGKTPIELFGAIEGEKVQQRFAACASTEMPFSSENYLILGGRETWWLCTINPIKNAEGRVDRIIGTTVEITDRKRAEAEREDAQAAQARLITILESTTDIVGMADVAGNSIYLNKAGQQVLGIPAEEMNQFHIGAVTAPAMWELMQTVVLPTAIQTGSWSGESALLTRNNEEIPISQVLVAHKNPQGDVEFFSTIIRDIRDRKRAEAQLNQRTVELEQTLQALQHTQTQMVQAEKMSGLGQLVAGVAHEINNPVNFIYGNLNHASSYTQDLLRLVQLYQQHYPTPHPAIQQEAEAIDLDFLTADLPKLLNSMKVGADRIQKIVSSLRNFSRMDEAEMKEVNIHDGIDSTLMILQHRLKAKADNPGIEVIKVYGDLPPVECYAGQLNQVLMNLLSNAIDALEEAFTPSGLPIIR